MTTTLVLAETLEASCCQPLTLGSTNSTESIGVLAAVAPEVPDCVLPLVSFDDTLTEGSVEAEVLAFAASAVGVVAAAVATLAAVLWSTGAADVVLSVGVCELSAVADADVVADVSATTSLVAVGAPTLASNNSLGSRMIPMPDSTLDQGEPTGDSRRIT